MTAPAAIDVTRYGPGAVVCWGRDVPDGWEWVCYDPDGPGLWQADGCPPLARLVLARPKPSRLIEVPEDDLRMALKVALAGAIARRPEQREALRRLCALLAEQVPS